MSRGEFGSPSYGTLSPNVRVNFDSPPSRYLEGKVTIYTFIYFIDTQQDHFLIDPVNLINHFQLNFIFYKISWNVLDCARLLVRGDNLYFCTYT